MEALGAAEGPVSEPAFGRFIGHARNALAALAGEFGDEERRPAFACRIHQLLNGRRIDTQLWQDIAGGYEDIGEFGRLVQSLAERA